MLRALLRGGDARGALFAAGALFGLMGPLARLACISGRGFSAPQLATVRFGIGALGCLALFAARPGLFRPVQHRLLLTRGALGGLAALLYFVALALIPAGKATLLNSAHPIFATLIASFTLGERPTLSLGMALAIATAGVLCVLGGSPDGVAIELGWGETAGIASAVLGGGAVASIRALRSTDNAPTIFFAFCLGGFILSAPFSFQAWPADPYVWMLALAVGLVSIAAQLLMTHALGELTVPEASVWQQLTPVASYLWAMVLLDEGVTRLGAFGVALGVVGIGWGAALAGGRRIGGGRWGQVPNSKTR
ncbi:MAG: DMT family transporter [Deltaproteobacteria bacterium]|nr:DMT family transporter [Deltaproteobacteria bacterium]